MSGPGALPRTAHCFFSFTEIRLQGPPGSYTFTLTKRVLRFFEGVKNLDKTKKGENGATRGLNVLSGEKRAPPRHLFLRSPPPHFSRYPILRETKRDIGKIKRDIGRTERAIVSTERDIISTKRAIVFAKTRRFPKKITKKSSRDGLFSHLKAGVARPNKFPPKSLRS